jgi:thiamine biosynthesis lipoprotein
VKDTRIIMGMPITIEILDLESVSLLEKAFKYFVSVDERFSTYKTFSEVSMINDGKLSPEQYSQEMREVLKLSEQTKKQTNNFFDIKTPQGKIDPSGLVKGWAILKAAKILEAGGSRDFYIDAGGDVQVSRTSHSAQPWLVGIQNPFNNQEIIKSLQLWNEGLATSGTYTRGQHIYNPHQPSGVLTEIISLTVVGPNVYEADRFATAAFAMGERGVSFIEEIPGLEAYQINKVGTATFTSAFDKYLIK